MGSTSSSTDMVKKVSKGAAKKEEFPKNAVEKKGRTFSIGGDVLPKGRDLTRFVRWPKYVRLQRAKMTLLKRIKVPPAINQFTNTFDKRQASQLFRLLNNLKPETRTEKKERLKAEAAAVAAGGKASSKRPVSCKMGINHVTTLIEEKKAKLVVLAHDVDPIEIVVWLPSLCKARGVPYCIVKSKGASAPWWARRTPRASPSPTSSRRTPTTWPTSSPWPTPTSPTSTTSTCASGATLRPRAASSPP